VIVELRCCYKKKDIKEQGIIIIEGEVGVPELGNFLFNYVGFFIGYSVVA
jgi:hypothetical protein